MEKETIHQISMLRYAITLKKKFPEIPDKYWDELGVGDLDNVRITITKED